MTIRQLLARFRAATLLLLTIATVSSGLFLASCSKEKQIAKRLEGSWNVSTVSAGSGIAPEDAVSTGNFTFDDDNKGTYTLNTTTQGQTTTESGSFNWDGSGMEGCGNSSDDDDDDDDKDGKESNDDDSEDDGTISIAFSPSERAGYSRAYRILKNEKRKQIWKTNENGSANVLTTATLTKK
jgi:hypothetical protein